MNLGFQQQLKALLDVESYLGLRNILQVKFKPFSEDVWMDAKSKLANFVVILFNEEFEIWKWLETANMELVKNSMNEENNENLNLGNN